MARAKNFSILSKRSICTSPKARRKSEVMKNNYVLTNETIYITDLHYILQHYTAFEMAVGKCRGFCQSMSTLFSTCLDKNMLRQLNS